MDFLLNEMHVDDVDGVEALVVQWMLSGGGCNSSYMDGGRSGGGGGVQSGGRRCSDRVRTGPSSKPTAIITKKAQVGKSRKRESKVVQGDADDVPITITEPPLLLPQLDRDDNLQSSTLPTHPHPQPQLNPPHLSTRLLFLQHMLCTWSSTISNLTAQMHLVSTTQFQDDDILGGIHVDKGAIYSEIQAAMLEIKALEGIGGGFGEKIDKAAERIKLFLPFSM